jgi:acetyltransferase-like isoleucine patch superfamily enzyme
MSNPRSPLALARGLAWRVANDPVARVALFARVMHPYWRWRLGAFGEGSMIHRPRWIRGGPKMEIGSNTLIYHDVWLSVEQMAWDQPGPALEIGSGTWIRPSVTIAAAQSIFIGDHVGIGGHSFITDLDHTMAVEGKPTFYQPINADPVRIGHGTWIGDLCAILRGSQIGDRCVIGSGSVVKGEIPDGSVAVGSPARVIGRAEDLAPR